MPVFTSEEIRNRAQQETRKQFSFSTEALTESIIKDTLIKQKTQTHFDVFLSHSVRDAELVLGMKKILEDMGHSVYVDWIEDPQLDRTKVNRETARLLQIRMALSSSLLYLTTDNSINSRWMPWECGFFDGLKEKVAIIPVAEKKQEVFQGQEYLGLYPWASKGADDSYPWQDILWINPVHTGLRKSKFKDWIKMPITRHK